MINYCLNNFNIKQKPLFTYGYNFSLIFLYIRAAYSFNAKFLIHRLILHLTLKKNTFYFCRLEFLTNQKPESETDKKNTRHARSSLTTS